MVVPSMVQRKSHRLHGFAKASRYVIGSDAGISFRSEIGLRRSRRTKCKAEYEFDQEEKVTSDRHVVMA
nr:hypothetical protein [Tanacetum cinerariifolium]